MTKRALLIGINEYRQDYVTNLRGSVNDMRLLAWTLEERFGFSGDHAAMLTDADATHSNIMAAMAELADAVEAGDVVVIGFSGHATQVPMPSAVEQQLTGLIPHDGGSDMPIKGFRPMSVDGAITILDWLPFVEKMTDTAAQVVMLLDTDQAARFMRAGKPQNNIMAQRKMYVQHAYEYEEEQSRLLFHAENFVFMGSSRGLEMSAEQAVPIGKGRRFGRHFGIFTRLLTQEMLRISNDTTWGHLHQRVAEAVLRHRNNQHPVILGAERAIVLNEPQPPILRYFIEEISERGVQFNAGYQHGISEGSQVVAVNESNAPIAVLRVTGVRMVRAIAEVVGYELLRPSEGNEVVLDTYVPEVAIRVFLDDTGVEKEATRLRDVLETSLLLQPQSMPQGAMVTVRAHEDHWQVELGVAGSNVVEQTVDMQQSQEILQVVDQSTGDEPEATNPRLLMKPIGVKSSWAVHEIRETLEQVARYQNLLSFENPDPANPLAGAVRFDLLRSAENEWHTVTEVDSAGLPVFAEGGGIAFRIVNESAKRVHMMLVGLTMGGQIFTIHPRYGSAEMPPGEIVEIGTDSEGGFGLYLDREAVRDVDTMKLFVSVLPFDISNLIESGTRITKGGDLFRFATPMSSALETVMTGRGADTPRPIRTTPGKEWVVLTRSYRIVANREDGA